MYVKNVAVRRSLYTVLQNAASKQRRSKSASNSSAPMKILLVVIRTILQYNTLSILYRASKWFRSSLS